MGGVKTDPVDGRIIRLGTRGSPLAMAQAHLVCAALQKAWPVLASEGRVIIVPMQTTGDRIQDRTLVALGGKGLFTQEIEQGLQDHTLDIAVHSMKDMPARLPEGLEIAAMLPREDVRDVLITRDGSDLTTLPAGAVIGTASLRRQALMQAARPDCRIVPLRGNVGTRLQKLSDGLVDATLLAVAGLRRLGRDDILAQATILSPRDCLPAVAQGAIGIESRVDDPGIRDMLAAISCTQTMLEVRAERAFLDQLDGSCRTPIGGLARLGAEKMMFDGLVAAPDGSKIWRLSAEIDVNQVKMQQQPEIFGRKLANDLRALLPADFIFTVDATSSKAI